MIPVAGTEPALWEGVRLTTQRRQAMPSYLLTDQYLRTNEYLVAANGTCFAIMQTDGNFCLYEGSGPAARGKFIWGSLSQSRPTADYYAVMQGDGNFCVYQGVPGGA